MNFISKDGNKVVDIPIRQIRPNQSQPRKTFKDEELNSLAASIEENGILQPLTVRRLNLQEYELVAGERRLRAAVIAGLKRVPCIVIKCTDRESAIFALLENLQRSDLGMFEEARGISRLIRKYNLTQEEAAAKLGKKQSTVANKLRLLKLTMDEQDWINQAGLSERHARALLRIADENLRKEALSKVISESLNINQTEELVDNIISSSFIAVDDKHRKKRVVIKDVRIFINTINKAVDTMRLAGINAVSKRAENDDYIEYTVRIPKNISSKKDDATDNKTA
ncbi:nucleoid occlusion protein [Anaeromassilibacillus sp. An172]|uniref:ParB/RepB/Spo0J family partition protein n=1 Tax=Anaeromassilibacillus sp. An172 TaxID=1965570 RepID=UPI000B3863ED|nr:ParB/RepB/Spo0J family partition protein [Anaeromassilibacillus sp. An172]MEE0762256.1 ParB/RepB/Spo0J family partition protein [Acutalibacteraceae bacterium]OUP77909.1 nucleoid occlusion protein [Anaeromassilibacillus sp. An172]